MTLNRFFPLRTTVNFHLTIKRKNKFCFVFFNNTNCTGAITETIQRQSISAMPSGEWALKWSRSSTLQRFIWSLQVKHYIETRLKLYLLVSCPTFMLICDCKFFRSQMSPWGNMDAIRKISTPHTFNCSSPRPSLNEKCVILADKVWAVFVFVFSPPSSYVVRVLVFFWPGMCLVLRCLVLLPHLSVRTAG